MLLLDTLFGGLFIGGLRDPWAWTAFSAVLWATACLRPPAWRSLPAAGWWSAWLTWTVVCAVLSQEPLRGLAACAPPTTALLFFALARTRWQNETKRLWVGFFLGAGTVLALAALLLSHPDRPMTGLFSSYKNYSGALAAAMFAACTVLILHRKKWPLTLAALSGIVISGVDSRGAVVAAATATAYALWRAGWKRLLAGLALGAVLFATFAPNPLLVHGLKLDRPGRNMRPQLWKAAWEVASDHPFFGEGPGQFDRGFLRHNFPAPVGHRPTRYGLESKHAHSEALQMAAETGWPGLAFFLIALAATWRRGSRGEAADVARAVSVSLLVSSLFDNIFFLPSVHWLFFSSLAVGSSIPFASICQSDGARGERLRAEPKPVPFMLLAAGLCLALLSGTPQWLVARRRARALQAPHPKGIQEIKSALSIAGEDSRIWEDLAKLHMKAGELHEALEALKEAESRNPTNAKLPLAAAAIFHANGQWDAVEVTSRRAIELEPLCPPGRLFLAEALLRTGRRSEAKDQLRMAGRSLGQTEQFDPDYDESIRTLDEPYFRYLEKLLKDFP